MIEQIRFMLEDNYAGTRSFKDAFFKTLWLVFAGSLVFIFFAMAIGLVGGTIVLMIMTYPWVAVPLVVLTVLVLGGSTIAYRVYGPREDR